MRSRQGRGATCVRYKASIVLHTARLEAGGRYTDREPAVSGYRRNAAVLAPRGRYARSARSGSANKDGTGCVTLPEPGIVPSPGEDRVSLPSTQWFYGPVAASHREINLDCRYYCYRPRPPTATVACLGSRFSRGASPAHFARRAPGPRARPTWWPSCQSCSTPTAR